MLSAAIFLVVGFALVGFGLILLKFIHKAASLPQEQTFTDGLDDIIPAIDRSHGAVRAGDGKTLKPDSRASSTLLESFF
ncbi:MAG: hypothetical protein RPU40_08045 [Candidatus Sedimenticola sp. (ex Thyasira tokunagai)]